MDGLINLFIYLVGALVLFFLLVGFFYGIGHFVTKLIGDDDDFEMPLLGDESEAKYIPNPRIYHHKAYLNRNLKRHIHRKKNS